MAQFVGTFSWDAETDAYLEGTWREKERAWLAELKAKLRSQRKGDLIGEELRWPRADGYARYIIVSERPFKIAHLYVGDGWHVEDALIRGLKLSEAREMVERDRRWAKYFETVNEGA